MRTRLLLLVCLSGCGPTLPETGEVPAPPLEKEKEELNGSVVFLDLSCSPAEQSKIRAGLAIAASQVRDTPWIMTECLAKATLSGDRNAYAEEIVDRLRENMPTRADCFSSSSSAATAPVGISSELVHYARQFLAVAAPEAVAAVTMHEIAHNKGYTHHDTNSDPNAAGVEEYEHTITRQVQACSFTQANGQNPPVPYGTLRTAVPDRAELGPVGRHGGYPGEIACGPGAFVHGLNLRTGGAVDQIALTCRLPNGTPAGTSATAGEAGGYPGHQECNPGELAIGFSGTAATTLRSVGLICNRADRIPANDLSFMRILPKIGDPNTGFNFFRLCPAGMALQSSFVRSGALVDRLRPVCQRIDLAAPQMYTDRSLPRIGGTAANAPFEEILECPGRSAIAHIDGTFGGDVFHLSSMCRGLSNVPAPNGTVFQRVDGSFNPKVEGVGGWGGTAAEQACPPNEVAIGLRGTASDIVHRIGLVCVNAEAWSRADMTAVALPLALLGPSSLGTPFDARCNRGEFLAGWKVRTGKWDWTRVTYLEPVCRRFANPHTCTGNCSNPLSVTVAGPGQVSSVPQVFNCQSGTTCTAQVGSATTVQLRAIGEYNAFGSWSGCTSIVAGVCNVSMTTARSVVATFTQVGPVCDYNLCINACVDECVLAGGLPRQCNTQCSADCAECL